MDKDIKLKYKKLANLMNAKSRRKIAVIQGLLDCFECMVTPEEADFLIKIGDKKLPFEELRAFSDLSDEKYEPFINDIQKKGLIFIDYKEDGKYAELSPVFPGWIEVTLSGPELDKKRQELAVNFGKLLKLKSTLNIAPVRSISNSKTRKKFKEEVAPMSMRLVGGNEKKRTISVKRKVENSETAIMPGRSVISFIESLPEDYPITLMSCFCRVLRKEQNEPCRFGMPIKACFSIGKMAKQMEEFGVGEFVSKEKAISIIEECEKKGAIHNVYHDGMDTDKPEVAICNCCWDCCGLYGTYNRGGLVPIFMKTYYISNIKKPEACKGCGTCEHYCPTGAITVKDSKSVLNSDMCIGCGQCAFQCPNSVIQMEYGERKVFVPSLPKSKARIK